METCPTGFFCFDKNTFILIVVSVILFVVYKIYINNSKLEIQKQILSNKADMVDSITKKLQKTSKIIKDLEDENLHLERRNSIAQHHHNEQMYVIDKDHQRVVNPLLPPERSYPYRINRVGVPINIPTRGYSSHYQQVGALIQEDSNDNDKKILPLFGKPTYPGSRQWLYYTGTDSYASVKLPVINSGRDCTGDHGCQEIYDGSSVEITGYNGSFKANIYQLDKPRYLPYVF